jgi:DNA-binding NarL/FixJ family response regulator
MPEPPRKTIRILLLDDHALFRESVSRLLGAEPGFEVAAHCATLEEGLPILKRQAIDVVLLDFDLGQRDGREFVRLAKEQGFRGKILVVTAGVEGSAAAELIRAGISGVFLKNDSASLLSQGIRDVMAGKVWLEHAQLQNALRSESAGSQPDRSGRFTAREQQVLSGVFEGLANKEIAGRIGVSESSVKASLQQLFSKTGVRTRSQLVRIVLEQHRDKI